MLRWLMQMVTKAEFWDDVLVAHTILEEEFNVGVPRVLLLPQPGLHWHPRAMPLFPTVVLCTALGLDAALSFLVLVLDFIMVGVVRLELAVLMFRAVTVRLVLVVRVVVAGVKGQSLPFPASWGFLRMRLRWRGACLEFSVQM